MQFSTIHPILIFSFPIPNKLGDSLGKRGFMGGEPKIESNLTPRKSLRKKTIFSTKSREISLECNEMGLFCTEIILT